MTRPRVAPQGDGSANGVASGGRMGFIAPCQPHRAQCRAMRRI
ncbi:hypothetical protein OCGS_0855 [Oceaniovalibus guishaninsula JLT2003]|uniref:Uncharacterized protein n=1 Tax=Oceaniovalibus guishaninsula JLT2003 TaxID=1231392 RepID=K2I828_9RHOB|nr:hypothetical protein OCGS_0855 [Oceaniovalibus guishaninsula JLT2003]